MKKYSARALEKQIMKEAYGALEVVGGMLKSESCKDADKLKAADMLLKYSLKEGQETEDASGNQVIRLVLGNSAREAAQ